MGLRRKIDGAVKGIAAKLGISYVLRQVRAAAEGKKGPAWKARYDWWAGKKTHTGIALMVLSVAVEALGQHDVALGCVAAGGLLSSVGLVDRAYRTYIPAGVADNGIYRFLVSHGELVAALLVGAAAIAIEQDCGRWCDVTQNIVLVLGAVAVQFRIIDPAWRTQPPKVDLAMLARLLEGEDLPPEYYPQEHEPRP